MQHAAAVDDGVALARANHACRVGHVSAAGAASQVRKNGAAAVEGRRVGQQDVERQQRRVAVQLQRRLAALRSLRSAA